MPVGRLNTQHSNAKRKEGNSEKIREIKQRQQNWLVQREQSKSKDNLNSKQKPNPNQKPISSAGASSKTSSYQPTIQSHRPPNNDHGKKRVTDTFNHWKKTRESRLPDEDIDTISIDSDAESELERLVSPDDEIAQHPIAEEEFGTLADKIASRVKHNMGISEAYVAKNYSTDEACAVDAFSEGSAWGPNRNKTFIQHQPTFNHNGNSSLASHHCSACKMLMFSPEHIPLMIIPCGHTMCKACSHDNAQCPECSCSIVSLTVNIMLQQVIQEYHNHIQGATSTATHTSPKRTLSGKTSNSTSYTEDNRRNKTASYRSQLLNLHTRQTILSGEHSDLVGKLGNLNKQIHNTSSQTKSIANQEHDVKKAIVDLQDKLEALETHRKQFESQLTEIHDERTETEGKLTLLSGTLASLAREVEKVKLLAEGEQNMD